jgi:hypothetical protein
MAEKVPKPVLYLLMLGMLVFGMVNTAFMKIQNGEEYYNEKMGRRMEFNHPFFQTFLMLIGEIILLPVYLVLKYITIRKYGSVEKDPASKEARKIGLKFKFNPVIMAIPCLFDITAS